MTAPSLSEIGRQLRGGELTSTCLVEQALEARRQSRDEIGPYKTWDPEFALRQASAADQAFAAKIDTGPLQGIPVSVKDLFGVTGWPTFAGTASQLPAAWERQGPVVQAIRRQLGVVMGKTHTVELAFGGLGTNPHWGTPRNPWDETTHRVPGGSSAGAGVSLIEGSALVAFGTDTAGSARIPASMTGVVGLKTTYGRWPLEGIVPLSPSLDSVGILARSALDLACTFESLERALFGDRAGRVHQRAIVGCRFGIPRTFFYREASDGVEDAILHAVGELERAGAIAVPLELEETEEAYALFLQGGIAGVELAAFLEESLPGLVRQLDPAVRDRVKASESMPATEYVRRRKRLRALSDASAKRLQCVDAFLTPTVAISPPAVAEIENLDDYRRYNLLALRNTSMANLLGLCALSIPCGKDALGMPVGMQLMAPPGHDASLIGLAMAVESVLLSLF